MIGKSKSIVKEKSYDFAVEIIRFCTDLKNHKHYEITGQLLRSGTSIGANIEESLAACSQKDFFAKMSIASKEARETHYWLRLIRDSKISKNNELSQLILLSEELIKILTSIVKTGYTKNLNNN